MEKELKESIQCFLESTNNEIVMIEKHLDDKNNPMDFYWFEMMGRVDQLKKSKNQYEMLLKWHDKKGG